MTLLKKNFQGTPFESLVALSLQTVSHVFSVIPVRLASVVYPNTAYLGLELRK